MKFVAASDQSLLVKLGEGISRECNREVHRLFHAIRQAGLPGTTGLSPAYDSILIRFDARLIDHAALETAIRECAEKTTGQAQPDPKRVLIPVIYDGEDLAAVAARHHLTVEAFVEAHSSPTYHCYLLGFVPGFAYLGDVPETIATPRRTAPRKMVPAGSVGIAGRQTGVYPVTSPGGWNLIGRTTVAMFDAARGVPLVEPGDEVRFLPVSGARP